MDTSEQYIKMCEKAPRELAELKWDTHLEVGLCAYHGKLLEISYDNQWECPDMEAKQQEILMRDIAERSVERAWSRLQKSDDWCEDKHWIKLPRQDQLQEMVFKSHQDDYNNSMYPMVGKFFNYVCGMYLKKEPFTSMEQLWLAFVMKEKYGKVWSGEEWQSEK